jgi:hypothetical protein
MAKARPFRYLRFKTFSMTPRTPQCKVFWALLLNSKHSGVPKDSKSPTLEVLGFTPTLGQSGVATMVVNNFLANGIPTFSLMEPKTNPTEMMMVDDFLAKGQGVY